MLVAAVGLVSRASPHPSTIIAHPTISSYRSANWQDRLATVASIQLIHQVNTTSILQPRTLAGVRHARRPRTTLRDESRVRKFWPRARCHRELRAMTLCWHACMRSSLLAISLPHGWRERAWVGNLFLMRRALLSSYSYITSCPLSLTFVFMLLSVLVQLLCCYWILRKMEDLKKQTAGLEGMSFVGALK